MSTGWSQLLNHLGLLGDILKHAACMLVASLHNDKHAWHKKTWRVKYTLWVGGS